MDNEIKVSVICNAYNHEKYIRDALDGFVMQKTNFKFEVLIHDDASTDHTADIIREYENEYPDIIKPIYSKENQYSKKDGSLSRIQYGRVKGRYIAICEGDDYWTDPLKLQKQYDAMEAHPEVDMCAHAAYKVVANTPKRIGVITPKQYDTIIPIEEVILGNGGYVATASLFYRAYINNTQPKFRQQMRMDYALQIQGSLRGGMLYLNDNMACYRVMAEGSWTERMQDRDSYVNMCKRMNNMLIQLNKDTESAYKDTIFERILKNEFNALQAEGKYLEIKKEPYTRFYNGLPTKDKLKINLKIYFPFLMDIKEKIRKRK